MTAKVWDAFPFQDGVESATTGEDSRNLAFYVTGTDEYDDAKAAFEAYFALTFDGLEMQRYRLKQLAQELWHVDANYGQLITQSHSFRVRTTGATARITHGYSETRYGPGGNNSTVPQQDAALNVQDGRIEGHEKVIPSMELALTYRFDRTCLTDAYIDRLENLTVTINAGAFGGRAAETLLFLGAELDQPATGKGSVNYNFLSGRHIQGLTLGQVTGISKKAHQFLWPLWETIDDTTANRNRKRIAGVYVNDVAEVVSWANFFPTAPV